ncbi:hypothetical protein GQ53DRAFT_151337 [Thozetella sp. PMI_491]|nr:hypothetical protein GQ53DRAFT_151337 [Thozetella sp. PMI_491]
MTRKDKCDACRKLKIKCDESLPSCSNCTKRGKECIHSESKRDFKFVDVTGETVSESSSSDSDTRRGHVGALDEQGTTKPGGGRKIALITTHRRKKPSKLQREVNKVTAANLGRLDLSCRPSETASLLARWFSMVPPQGDSSQEYLSDSYVMWSLHIPQLIGKSRAINDAARCFMDCKLALANPSDVNIRAAESSNVAAVGSVRLALIESGPQSCTNELFLSIQILVVVESLMFHTRNCMIIHVRGLLSLLKQQKDRLMRRDPKDAVIRAIFMANCAPGVRILL